MLHASLSEQLTHYSFRIGKLRTGFTLLSPVLPMLNVELMLLLILSGQQDFGVSRVLLLLVTRLSWSFSLSCKKTFF